MKNQNQWKLVGYKLEYHLNIIKKYKNKGNILLSQGMPLNSRKLIRLNRLITKHEIRALILCERSIAQIQTSSNS